MLRSMTGFGSAIVDNGTYKFSVEIKAVNNRYKDIAIRMPSSLRALEASIVELLNKYMLRGKIDIYINFTNNSEQNKQLTIDKDLLIAYYKSLQEINDTIESIDKKSSFKKLSLVDLANFQGIINLNDEGLNLEEIKPLLLETVEQATLEFIKMKSIEGENLKVDLLKRLETIKEYTEKIKIIAPERLTNYRKQLIENLKTLLSEKEIDENRIIQECAIMADKLDITEEIVRLNSHLQQFKTALNAEGNIGRKMDFIIQEMNRETNTIASKANNTDIANFVVDIKGELEKIREQVQNIE